MEKLIKKKERTREEYKKSVKTWKLLFIFACILIAVTWLIPTILQSYFELKNTTQCPEPSEVDSGLIDNIKGFVYGILELQYPFFTKILIFLGMIYLVMIMFNIAGDIIHLLLLLGLLIFKTYKKLFKKEKGK